MGLSFEKNGFEPWIQEKQLRGEDEAEVLREVRKEAIRAEVAKRGCVGALVAGIYVSLTHRRKTGIGGKGIVAEGDGASRPGALES